jgi:DNA polymerase III subunit epsilon
MRHIILDTETTGLEPGQGHRIIELAGVEIINRRLTGNRFHRYLNPQRDSDAAALQIHGLTTEFLADKPKFSEIRREFLDYVSGAVLIIHNAPFDVAFLDNELALCEAGTIAQCCPSVVDTLVVAKELHPAKRNSLDALCERYQIDNSRRTLHGALLDAELLAEVYLAMTRGQESLAMELDVAPVNGAHAIKRRQTLRLIVLPASPEELLQHAQVLEHIGNEIKQPCIWHESIPMIAGTAA